MIYLLNAYLMIYRVMLPFSPPFWLAAHKMYIYKKYSAKFYVMISLPSSMNVDHTFQKKERKEHRPFTRTWDMTLFSVCLEIMAWISR